MVRASHVSQQLHRVCWRTKQKALRPRGRRALFIGTISPIARPLIACRLVCRVIENVVEERAQRGDARALGIAVRTHPEWKGSDARNDLFVRLAQTRLHFRTGV